MRKLPAACASLVLAGLFAWPAEAAPVTGRCVINEAAYLANSQAELVSDTSHFTDMPEVTLDFVQGGTAPGCVIVTFSAESFSPQGTAMIIRPTLDENTRSVPASVQFAANDPNLYTSRTATFVFRHVSVGPHTIRMQFMASPAEHTEIGKHTMVVQHQR